MFTVAVLDRAAEVWNEPGVAELFTSMVSLKLHGYWSAYEPGALPVDTGDFYATHVLVMQEGDPRPVMGFRFTTLDQCRSYHATFPAESLTLAAGAREHYHVVNRLVSQCGRAGRGIAYAGSWTIVPDVVEGRDDLRDLAGAALVLLSEHAGISDVVVGGTLRFKTDRLFDTWGFKPIGTDAGPLPPLNVTHLGGEEVLVMHVTEYSENVRASAERWRPVWDARRVFGPAHA